MKAAFIINDFKTMNLEKDTSIFLIKEAQKNKIETFAFDTSDVSIEAQKIKAKVKEVTFNKPVGYEYSLSKKNTHNLEDFDFVINRLNPPFNKEYLYLTHLLEIFGIKAINPPKALREINEKLSILNFPDLAPKTIVTASIDEIRSFVKENGKAVLKPLDGMGGKSIFFLSSEDKNINVIWENVTKNGRNLVMIQEFVEEAKDGDNRLVFINYKLLPYKLIRIPSTEDFRGNLAAGATSEVCDITKEDEKAAEQIIPFLKKNRIYFAGADMLGNYISELNITSPTCLQEINNSSECNPGEIFWKDLIEIKKSEYKRN
tara:strand:- start:535 stop:1485 length:951 start_codon:yes stop_codon:yes gene_type:complete